MKLTDFFETNGVRVVTVTKDLITPGDCLNLCTAINQTITDGCRYCVVHFPEDVLASASFLGMFIKCAHRMKTIRGTIAIAVSNPVLYKLFQTANFGAVAALFPSRELALGFVDGAKAKDGDNQQTGTTRKGN